MSDVRRLWDWPLFFTAIALMGLGLLAIYTSSSWMGEARFGDPLRFVMRQGMALGLGVGLGTVAFLMPWNWVRKASWPFYGLCLVLLLLLLTPLAHEANGATRWLRVGPLNLQPSELTKLGLVMVLAQYLSANRGRLHDVFAVGVTTGLIALPAVVLVMLQPDFGTTAILVGLVGVLLFVAGLQWRWLFILGGSTLAALTVFLISAPYRVQRLTSFLDPFQDSSGAGYQVVQGWIAMANGGLLGRGLGLGVAQRGFLPEPHNDFVAAVIAEELGAVGWVGVVCLFGIVLWRGMAIAARAEDFYSMLVGAACTSLLAAQAAMNLSVVGGLVPNKGLVLPFLSYGASATMVFTCCVALLLRISHNHAHAVHETEDAEVAA